MANQDSVQKKLAKVRAPRVHLTYDVEVGDSIETKEIPFVVGVLGEISGDSVLEQPRLKDKKFVVDLAFNRIDDFRPEAVAAQIEPLKQLVQARDRLADLRNKISANEKLEDLLDEVLKNTEQVRKMAEQNLSDGE